MLRSFVAFAKHIIDDWTSYYAATDEKHDPAVGEKMGADLVSARGIEVGHIFHFGTKYSEPLGAKVTGPTGEQVTVLMGSYGIGVSRLVGGIIEASHDDNGIIWPTTVAPFDVHIVALNLDQQPVVVRGPAGDWPTGLVKLGAILGDRAEVGCNAVLNPGSVLGRRALVMPTVPFSGYLPDATIAHVARTVRLLPRRD